MPNDVLSAHVAMAVPLRIDEIKRAGGPTDEDIRRVGEYATDIGARGDLLLFPGAKKGVATGLVNKVVDGVAVLAFMPGGVEMFGTRYEAGRPGPS